MSGRPPVAIVHDYLTQLGGAERVVLDLVRAFPDAPLYTSIYAPWLTYDGFRDLDVRTTVLDRSRYLKVHHRAAFPLYAPVFSSLHVDADVVVCSSSGWAHGVRTEGAKLVYCHAVARWLTQSERYLGHRMDARALLRKGALAAAVPPLRSWDRHAAASATRYLANSEVTRRAVARQYGIEADVVHPPIPRIDAPARPVEGLEPGFFLCVNRLLPYKNVDVVCDAFHRLPYERLVVVGTGPMLLALRDSAPPNVKFMLRLDDAELRWCYEQSVGLVAASHEDFGLTVLEAAAAGRPAAALRAGGYLETVIEGRTGVFFDEPEPAAIAAAIGDLAARDWDVGKIRAHADDFSPDRFAHRMRDEVARLAGHGNP